MQTITLEPLRWQEDPSRITVRTDDSQVAVAYQVTSPKSAAPLCCGRPVEELPRILPWLSPVHHLTAALALDRLFQVDPPELARNMRMALLQAQYCSSHLRKIFFLLTGSRDPFGGTRAARGGRSGMLTMDRMLERVMQHAALAQEAEDILGGRHDHPLTAVAGGVSRHLKEEHIARLAEIGAALQDFAAETAEFMRTRILADGGLLQDWSDFAIPQLAGFHLDDGGNPTLTDPTGAAQQFDPGRLGDIVALQQEPWTCQPFAYLGEKGWHGVEQTQGFFYVGPLARLNAGQPAAAPRAEEERQRMIACLGPPPLYSLGAAYGALAVELIQAAEILHSLAAPGKLAGPVLRAIPKGRAAAAGWSALEGPQGLTWHHYRVDGEGIVQSLVVIEPRVANNALKCMLAKKVVMEMLARDSAPASIKERAATALLPF